ncbi:cell elongation-specific peptidoglycan biosynthesis regulator RodA [Hasllibacter halocynthiae]|uniref:Peptidoglycan glycosyltransferase MrdB n=1 Tax=Hasllibacter halocynthiae TaxID=595589 RepID=A0A2T0X9V5_9RHOB|nr:rod shape-determining protein RodA [Hasllibacter halocynthiae]PRY95703.1 cell elongation-specific peptidoglycan biosynthesis regulator RodA [Hasllibacter halocynthiae]
MSYLEANYRAVPSGWRKILYLNWPLVVLLTAVASVGFLVLYSVADGSWAPWAEQQSERFVIGLVAMVLIAMVPTWFWRNMSLLAYLLGIALLLGVEFFGVVRGGAQRWLNLGGLVIQPSELMKIALVMMLAAYYDWLDVKKVSRPHWVLIPVVLILVPAFLVLEQPDLGTAMLLVAGGGLVMFVAGVSWWYFIAVGAGAGGLVYAVLESRGKDWQLLQDYQYQRIDTFLDPSTDPLGAGYNITQAQIALGSGGWSGKGFMQGTQTRLDFLPEAHTDFIITTLAEQFGFIGALTLLVLYMGIVFFCVLTALRSRDRFAALLVIGIAASFFLYFAINIAMVTGLAPVVGVPLPMVSYGGTVMVILMAAFGLVQSAHVHRPRGVR